MKSRFNLITALLLVVVLAGAGFANGLSLNSIGPRALGMGGAFVGLANDASAIYWNPAGLSGQNSHVMVFMTDIIPTATYQTPDGVPAAYAVDAQTKSNHYISPNLFAAYNMGDWTLGLGVFVPAGLGAEWDKADFGAELMSYLRVVSFSPSVAYKINDQFSLGLAVNVFYGMMDMKRNEGTDQYSEESSGTGVGATIGLKYNFTEQLSLGITYKTPVKVAFEGDADMGALAMDIKRDIEWPTWIGVGLAYHVCENWVITLDGQYSNWKSLESIETESSFDHPLAGPMTVNDTLDLKWESALQIRVGTAYQVNDQFTIRGGYYYDPAPAPDETLNILFPSSTNHAFTAGASYAVGDIMIDLGLEYLLGAERDIEMNAVNEMPGKHQLNIFAFSLGLGYSF